MTVMRFRRNDNGCLTCRVVCTLACFFCLAGSGKANDNRPSTLPFIRDSLCLIHDPANTLSGFINEINNLRNGKDTVINVVHIGDSHIQAGFLSGQTMRLLQNSFGNAGRGWITPFKLSKVNEPPDYYILSNVKDWTAGRCVQLKPKCPWGIGGIGIQTEARDIDFRLIITPKNGAGYSFNKVLLFRDSKAAPMAPVSRLDDSLSLACLDGQPFENIHIDTFTTSCLVDTLAVRSIKSLHQSKSNLYYGFMLTNGNPGILYHAIGVNGAKFTDYTDRDYIRRLSLLSPSLLIISLGTNESFGRYFRQDAFEMQLDAFVRLIREELPETTIMVSTPAETFRSVYKNKKRQYVRNENISKVAEAITSFAEKESVACWDLYTISGGQNSCQKWYDAKMFGRDRIHFSRDGYAEQGALLYKALARACDIPAIDDGLRFWETDETEVIEAWPAVSEAEIEEDGMVEMLRAVSEVEIEEDEEAGDVGAYPRGCPSEAGEAVIVETLRTMSEAKIEEAEDVGAYPRGCPSEAGEAVIVETLRTMSEAKIEEAGEADDVGAYPRGCPSEAGETTKIMDIEEDKGKDFDNVMVYEEGIVTTQSKFSFFLFWNNPKFKQLIFRLSSGIKKIFSSPGEDHKQPQPLHAIASYGLTILPSYGLTVLRSHQFLTHVA